MTPRFIRYAALAAILSFPTIDLPVEAQQKTKITRADELPRRSYQVTGTALGLLDDAAQLARLRDELYVNARKDLDQYDIQDKATLSGYYAVLTLLEFLKGNDDAVLALIAKQRDLEDKPAEKAVTGLFMDSYIAAKRATGKTDGPDFRKAFEKNYAAFLANIPYALVKDQIEQQKGRLTLANREVTLGQYQAQFQPILEKTKGLVPEDIPVSVLSLKFSLDTRLPLRDEMLRALTNYYNANNATVKKIDIWADRQASLAGVSGLKPVVAAVWDTGVDMNVLPEANRFVNAAESVDGKDNDGNGYIDDVHGIGYDLVSFTKSVGTLDKADGKIKGDVKQLQRLTKGALDLQASISSPEATELQRAIGSLKREQAKDFQEGLSYYGNYAHGTHVAGIVADGNPAVRILGARMTWDHRTLPPAPTRENSEFRARMYRDTVEYFKRNGVRVVNMSWRYGSAAYEGLLAANGVGKDDAERKALANEFFRIERDALYDAFKNAPDILFICGSGNENNDANFSEYIPASFDLPNLVTIGAVDGEGKRTSFTTEGKSVDFFANGFEVESFVPGGDRLKFSGTSMASPQVANLAAKLLAINPALTPREIVELIDKGSDRSTENAAIKLINPKKTLELVKK